MRKESPKIPARKKTASARSLSFGRCPSTLNGVGKKIPCWLSGCRLSGKYGFIQRIPKKFIKITRQEMDPNLSHISNKKTICPRGCEVNTEASIVIVVMQFANGMNIRMVSLHHHEKKVEPSNDWTNMKMEESNNATDQKKLQEAPWGIVIESIITTGITSFLHGGRSPGSSLGQESDRSVDRVPWSHTTPRRVPRRSFRSKPTRPPPPSRTSSATNPAAGRETVGVARERAGPGGGGASRSGPA